MSAILICALALTSPALKASKTEYFGTYFNGVKVGYLATTTEPATFRGRKARKTISIGESLNERFAMHFHELSYSDPSGRPIRSIVDVAGSHGSEHEEIEYRPSFVSVKKTLNGGSPSLYRLPIRRGQKISSDALSGVNCKNAKAGSTLKVYVVNAAEHSIVENTVVFKGKTRIQTNGAEVGAYWVRVQEPDSYSDRYINENDEMIKSLSLSGFELLREPRTLAMSGFCKSSRIRFSDVVPVEGMRAPDKLTELVLNLQVESKGTLPSDDHQTATKTALGWTIEVHPSRARQSLTIAEAAAMQPKWILPDERMPSRNPRLVKLAKQIVGTEKTALRAACRIQAYVTDLMQYDDSHSGGWKNAVEILDSHRGVCLDYAILCTTLMRAANIPARLAVGLVGFDDGGCKFGWHAWVTVFADRNWVGLDPTLGAPKLSAAYVEFSNGTYADIENVPVAREIRLRHATLTVISSKQE